MTVLHCNRFRPASAPSILERIMLNSWYPGTSLMDTEPVHKTIYFYNPISFFQEIIKTVDYPPVVLFLRVKMGK